MKVEYLFKIKKILDPKDDLAIWILTIAMSRNDLIYVHKRFIRMENGNMSLNLESLTDGEKLYLLRLSVAHLKEIVKFLAFEKNKPGVVRFISNLKQDLQDIYFSLLFSKDDEFLNEVIDPIRHNLFHYALKDFQKNYSEMDDMFSKIIANSEKIYYDSDFQFAVEVALNISFGRISEVELGERLNKLSTIISNFIKFANDVVWTYMLNKSDDMKRITTK